MSMVVETNDWCPRIYPSMILVDRDGEKISIVKSLKESYRWQIAMTTPTREPLVRNDDEDVMNHNFHFDRNRTSLLHLYEFFVWPMMMNVSLGNVVRIQRLVESKADWRLRRRILRDICRIKVVCAGQKGSAANFHRHRTCRCSSMWTNCHFRRSMGWYLLCCLHWWC